MAITFDKVRAHCAWCDTEFRLRDRVQLGALNSGRNVYCSKECSAARNVAAQAAVFPYQRGPCPTCGKMFPSRQKEKKFCSMSCYTASDQFQARMLEHNKAQAKPPGICLNCGKPFPFRTGKKHCNRACYREYYAARFDRWVANPERLALPQCYDEFLLQAELPCLITGCDWTGVNLSRHCNSTHGVTASQLKELAGFNATTGLVTADLSRKISENFKGMIADGTMKAFTPGQRQPRNSAHRSARRLEGAEHANKAMAIARSVEPSQSKPCRGCGVDVIQKPVSRKWYCSIECRRKHYERIGAGELQCSHCAEAFLANLNQLRRARRGQKVCCSSECRNKMNMAACLAARGISPKTAPEVLLTNGPSYAEPK